VRTCAISARTRKALASQRGFSLLTALFLIVVVSLLAAVAVRVGSRSEQTVNNEILAARALQAASAGVEWAAYNAVTTTNCRNRILNLSESTLRNFRVQVTCSAISHTVGTGKVWVFSIESFAAYGNYGQVDYTTRRVRAQFTTDVG
jgi:MSHA biogenesis protein MshP